METTWASSIKATKINKRDEESINLFKRFYTGVFAEGFRNKDEYIPLEDVLSWLYSDDADSAKTNIIVFTEDSTPSKAIIGGVVFDYFDEINIIGLEFIVVSSAYRRFGLGSFFMEHVLKEIHDNAGDSPEWMICETESTNFAMQNYMSKNGWSKIKFSYKQPSLSEGQGDVELWLMAKYLGDEKKTVIPKQIVEDFILNYARCAMHIAEPNKNPIIVEMLEDMNRFKSLDLNPIETIN